MDRHLYEMLLLSQASNYDLRNESGRKRSNSDLTHFFSNLQKAINPQFTLEIGACRAEFSLSMARLGLKAFAFEANPYNFQIVSPQIAATGENIEYIHTAVGDTDGVADFHLRSKAGDVDIDFTQIWGNNSLLKRSDTTTEYHSVKVPVTTINTFLMQRNLIGKSFSCWIDVEGLALEVITGFQTCIHYCHSLLVEVEQWPAWNRQALSDNVVSLLLGKGFVPVARDFEYPHQYNIVFIRSEILDNCHVKDELVKWHQRRFSHIA